MSANRPISNDAEAMQTKACEQQLAQAKTEQEALDGLEKLKQLSADKNRSAKLALGKIYLEGKFGIAVNINKSAIEFSNALSQSAKMDALNQEAMQLLLTLDAKESLRPIIHYNMGIAFSLELGVQTDPKKAQDFFARGASKSGTVAFRWVQLYREGLSTDLKASLAYLSLKSDLPNETITLSMLEDEFAFLEKKHPFLEATPTSQSLALTTAFVELFTRLSPSTHKAAIDKKLIKLEKAARHHPEAALSLMKLSLQLPVQNPGRFYPLASTDPRLEEELFSILPSLIKNDPDILLVVATDKASAKQKAFAKTQIQKLLDELPMVLATLANISFNDARRVLVRIHKTLFNARYLLSPSSTVSDLTLQLNAFLPYVCHAIYQYFDQLNANIKLFLGGVETTKYDGINVINTVLRREDISKKAITDFLLLINYFNQIEEVIIKKNSDGKSRDDKIRNFYYEQSLQLKKFTCLTLRDFVYTPDNLISPDLLKAYVAIPVPADCSKPPVIDLPLTAEQEVASVFAKLSVFSNPTDSGLTSNNEVIYRTPTIN